VDRLCAGPSAVHQDCRDYLAPVNIEAPKHDTLSDEEREMVGEAIVKTEILCDSSAYSFLLQ
jgi:hypothetical protein